MILQCERVRWGSVCHGPVFRSVRWALHMQRGTGLKKGQWRTVRSSHARWLWSEPKALFVHGRA